MVVAKFHFVCGSMWLHVCVCACVCMLIARLPSWFACKTKHISRFLGTPALQLWFLSFSVLHSGKDYPSVRQINS